MRVSAERQTGREVLRASGKAVWAWPSVVAVDAGPMQIQLREGVSLRCAELCSRAQPTTLHDRGVVWDEGVLPRPWWRRSAQLALARLRIRLLRLRTKRRCTDNQKFVVLSVCLEFHFVFINLELDRGIGWYDRLILRLWLPNLIFSRRCMYDVLLANYIRRGFLSFVLRTAVDGLLRDNCAFRSCLISPCIRFFGTFVTRASSKFRLNCTSEHFSRIRLASISSEALKSYMLVTQAPGRTALIHAYE